uniref:EGF-like domain-containing protein n=1 Tax=Leersia perrieri TaxID=77586 RepID=A0A0D9XJS8_9ORYZ
MAAAARTMIHAPPPCLLLLLLLAAAAAATVADAAPACETAHCSRGHCVEQPGIFGLDTFRCDCDAGWSNVFKLIPSSPCTVPNCTFDSACFNLSLFTIPKGIPITDPCVAINCGPGQCVKDEGLNYHCACEPGFVNMLNLTGLPCIKNCAFGMDCSAMGLSPPGSPPPPSSSSSPATPGSVSAEGLLKLLVLLSLAMAHIL